MQFRIAAAALSIAAAVIFSSHVSVRAADGPPIVFVEAITGDNAIWLQLLGPLRELDPARYGQPGDETTVRMEGSSLQSVGGSGRSVFLADIAPSALDAECRRTTTRCCCRQGSCAAS